MTALIIDSTVRGSTCQRTGTRARGLGTRRRCDPTREESACRPGRGRNPVRWPAEKQGAAQLLPLSFPFPFAFPFPLLFVFSFPFPFPFPFPSFFFFPFAFPFPLLP